MDPISEEIPVSSSSLAMHSLATTIFCCQDIASINAQPTEVMLSPKHQKLIESFIAESMHILKKGYPRVKKGLRKPDSFCYVIEVTTRAPNNGCPKLQLEASNPYRWFVPFNEKLVASKKVTATKARKPKKIEKAEEYDVRKCVENPNYGTTQQNWIEIKSVDVPKKFAITSKKNEKYLRYACNIEGHDKEWSIRVIESSTPKRRRNKRGKKTVKGSKLKANQTITKSQPVVSDEIANTKLTEKWEESEFMADDESSDDTDDLNITVGQDKKRNYPASKGEIITLMVENVNVDGLASIDRGRSPSTTKNEQLSDEKDRASKRKAKRSLEQVFQSIESQSEEKVLKKTAVEDDSKKRKAGRCKSAGGLDEEYDEEKTAKRRKVEKDPKGKGKGRKNSKKGKKGKRKAMPEDRVWGPRFHYPKNIF